MGSNATRKQASNQRPLTSPLLLLLLVTIAAAKCGGKQKAVSRSLTHSLFAERIFRFLLYYPQPQQHSTNSTTALSSQQLLLQLALLPSLPLASSLPFRSAHSSYRAVCAELPLSSCFQESAPASITIKRVSRLAQLEVLVG